MKAQTHINIHSFMKFITIAFISLILSVTQVTTEQKQKIIKTKKLTLCLEVEELQSALGD